MIGTRAMVMAAGMGNRMRPITNTIPKPLVPVKGKPLIGYAFDALRSADVTHAVVNVHYLAEQVEAWCEKQNDIAITISDEREALLETGGGIVKALPHLGSDPFFVMNSDSFWLEHGTPALQRLKAAWRDDEMDCLLLLIHPKRTTGFDSIGDFEMDAAGRLTRRKPKSESALAYIGGYLVHPRMFRDAPEGKFSTNILWDRAIAEGRLFGLEHKGWWLHVGTPEAIGQAEAQMTQS